MSCIKTFGYKISLRHYFFTVFDVFTLLFFEVQLCTILHNLKLNYFKKKNAQQELITKIISSMQNSTQLFILHQEKTIEMAK